MLGMIISLIASLAVLILSCYLMFRKRTAANVTLSVGMVLLALIEFTDQYVLYHAAEPLFWKHISIALESLLPFTFLFFSLTYARQTSVKSISPIWWILLVSTFLFPASLLFFQLNDFIYAPDLQTEKMMFLSQTGYWFYMGMMIYCILALINLETTFSSTYGSERWRMKFKMIGIASILSVLVFYFSQGLLYRVINMSLMPVRSCVLIIASSLIGYSEAFRGNDVRVQVSRYIFYRSFTLLIVGLYLIILGLVGEGMRYLDIPYSKDLTAFLAFASGIMLFIVLLSETLRRKVKVIISKHFFTHKHDYRDAWLKITGKLSECKTLTDVHQAVLKSYIEAFGLTGASLYLFNKARKIYTLAAHLSMPSAPADFSPSAELFAYFLDRDRILNPHDDEYAPTTEESAFIRQTESRLIVPLIFNKKVEGIVVLKKQLILDEFIYEDYDLMKTLAKQASQSLVTFTLTEELIETREFNAVSKLSSFVIHDIKNLTYSISLMLNNAENFIDNSEFQDDMLKTLKNTVFKMKHLIQKLKVLPEKQSLYTRLADVSLLTREIIADIQKMQADAEILFQGSSAFAVVDGEEIKKVILNLVMNALESVGQKGIIRIETGTDGNYAFLKVSDNGCGITDDFIKNHLFKPFRTTKEKGLGIGLYQCKQIVEAHGGNIKAESVPGEGTVFTVRLPALASPHYAVHTI